MVSQITEQMVLLQYIFFLDFLMGSQFPEENSTPCDLKINFSLICNIPS